MQKNNSKLLHISPEFWSNKRILITGHTGFKGAWLTIWLHKLGAEVTGISLPPLTEPNLYTLAGVNKLCKTFYCDIRNYNKLANCVKKANPEIVFHLAAQSIVLESYKSPIDTFSTNLMGTVNLLDALLQLKGLKAIIVITTDKVYKHNSYHRPYKEIDPLGGKDPYSASKAASEIATSSYFESFFLEKKIPIATARSGNVIGGGDWAKHRLIPDAIRAWSKKRALIIRKPNAIRPWQHLLEPLSAYLLLAKSICEDINLSGAYNFASSLTDCITVRDLILLTKRYYGKGQISFSKNKKFKHEEEWLKLNTNKAKKLLGFKQKWGIEKAVKKTIYWYKEQMRGVDSLQLCHQDICSYEDDLWKDSQ